MAKKKKEPLTPEQRLQEALVPCTEWPYKIPENWCWVKLESINQYLGHSITPASSPDEIFELYSVPSSAENFPEIVSGSKVGSSKQSAQKDDVLLCKINPRINRVWKVSQHTDHTLLASSEWIIVRNPTLVSDYLMWVFRSNYFRKYMLSNVSGVGGSLMRAQPKYVQNYPVPLPPLSEQQRIVDRIESLFAQLDEAKEKAQAALDSFEPRKVAILHKAFTGELTTKWREEHGIKIENWKKRPLKSCGEWFGGGTPSMQHPEYWDNGDILWVTSKDMKSDLIQDTLMHTNILGVENSSARYIDKPSILFVTRSGILRRTFPVCMVKKPFTVNQDLKVLTPTGIDLEFIFWVCKAHEREILDTCMKNGTTVESINTTALKSHKIPVPSVPEQEKIVRILDSLLAKEQQAKETAEAVLEQIDLTKKSILSRAFRGELDTNDPNEESAIELIKQLLSGKLPEEKKPAKRRKDMTKAMVKTILEVLTDRGKMTPEQVKAETGLEIDNFYAELKQLIKHKTVIESKVNGISYLEAKHED